MKRILIPILLSLIGCTSRPKSVEKLTVDTLVEMSKPTAQANVDTGYVPLDLKFEGSNTIAIRRNYYNPKDYNYYHQTFFLNGKKIFTDSLNYLVDSSKYTRIIIDNDNVLMFMECDGRPNLDYLSAYAIDLKNKKMTYLSSSVFNNSPKSKLKPFTDIDGDGFLEYGGFDLTEMHPHPDSMYYHPSSFYEIRNGKLFFDSLLTKSEDIRVNGIYVKNPMNLTIRKPKK
jgi:hypothetical protein